jgi:hypothetical protein
MSSDKHVLRTQTWTYDPWIREKRQAQLQEQGKKQESDSLYMSLKRYQIEN